METYLKNAVGRDVVVMTGAEATGYGEMQYGDGSTSKGITVCVTLGKTIGISLFDNGVLAHNPQLVRHLPKFEDDRKVKVSVMFRGQEVLTRVLETIAAVMRHHAPPGEPLPA